MPVSILDLKSSAKGDFTAEAQISQRKIVYCPTQTYASLHIEPGFVSGILCALSVSAVHYSAVHYHTPCKRPLRRSGEEAAYRMVILVPETGLEPVRGCPHRFLRPKRLPFRHSGSA